MQIWTPSPDVRDEGDFAVRFNPSPVNHKPFAVIEFSQDGQTSIAVQSVADADRLIKAACAAKDLLLSAAADEASQ